MKAARPDKPLRGRLSSLDFAQQRRKCPVSELSEIKRPELEPQGESYASWG